MQGVDASDLPDVSRITDEESAVAALGQTLESVSRANLELASRSKGTQVLVEDDLPDRLRKWGGQALQGAEGDRPVPR